jgi:hypothetical protein
MHSAAKQSHQMTIYCRVAVAASHHCHSSIPAIPAAIAISSKSRGKEYNMVLFMVERRVTQKFDQSDFSKKSGEFLAHQPHH